MWSNYPCHIKEVIHTGYLAHRSILHRLASGDSCLYWKHHRYGSIIFQRGKKKERRNNPPQKKKQRLGKKIKFRTFNCPDIARVLTEFPNTRFFYIHVKQQVHWDAFAALCVHRICFQSPASFHILSFPLGQRWKMPKSLPQASLQENKACICKNEYCFFT